jgi:eukaryotic-like serine/threonine-protein kinase
LETSHTVHPTSLGPGSLVGPWRLLALVAQGTQGVVFRAERAAAPEAGPVALKVAIQPGDPRFALEIELLSRTQHPNVPRLRDSGQWSGPGGAQYPFLVMEWVEGLPLYSWARLQARRPRELLRVLAQAASAIQGVHAAGGIHQDIKGDNILVRPEDGRAVLVDFGSCTYRGAPVLTRASAPPGAPQYHSPQAQLHEWKFRRQPAARYECTAADDVYALGVTAYRLATGRYPLIAEDIGTDDDLEDLFSHFPELVPADALVQLSPELARWIRQMLSVEPEPRGTPAELAIGLALSADTEGPAADQPIISRMATKPTGPETMIVSSLEDLPWKKGLKGLTLLAVLVAGGCMIQALRTPAPLTDTGEYAQAAGFLGQEDSTTRLAEAGLTQPLNFSGPTRPGGITAPVPSEPLPGQRLPPCKGPQLEINGGCWFLVGNAAPPCAETTYEWRKRCYAPSMGPSRPSTTGER